MAFFAEIQLLLIFEFGLVSNVCKILGYWIIDPFVLEKNILKICYIFRHDTIFVSKFDLGDV